MENIILIGHGSPRNEANNIDIAGRLLHNAIHPNCGGNCVKVAYLQFAKPEIADAIKECVESGAKKIIIHPFFLTSGMHVTKDIPEIIGEAEALYPDREFIYTEPLGIHEKLLDVVMERINSADALKPGEIEKKSFEILSEETDLTGLPPEQLPVVKRVIHATADFEFRNTLMFHPDAIRKGLEAIKAGKDILTDVEMVRTGINKKLLDRWGGRVICNINEESRTGHHHDEKATRAEIGIEKALRENNGVGIVAIGNAPTALLKVISLFNSPAISVTAPLVIGVPVGFVKAIESKTLLAVQPFPFITNLSRKGGTPVAVAIVNALLKMAAEG